MGQIARYMLIFFESYSFFYVVFRIDFRRKSKRNILGIMICCLIILVSMTVGLKLEENATPFTILLFLIDVILYFVFEVSIVEMVGLAFGEWLVLSILEMTIYVALEHLNLERYILENTIMIITSILLWSYYLVLGKKVEQRLFQLPVKMWYLFDLIMLILTAMMELFSYVIVEELPDGKVTGLGKGFVILGGDLIVVLLFVMIYYFNRTESLQIQNELIETQSEQQRKYFLQLLKKEDETRCFRHDIINDLLELQNYCIRQDYDKLESYLESTLGTIKNISNGSYDVGNDIVNTVLNYYLQPMKENYEVEVDGYMGEVVSIEQRDLCAVSANLIKNAVEELKRQGHGQVTFGINQGTQYLFIKVENTFEGKLNLGKDGLPETTKKDQRKHGIGLQNVKRIVQKYYGKYSIDVVNGRYLIEIFLKL